MNITFNINDDSGSLFISASKWSNNQPTWTDDKAIKKPLKVYISSLIDQYKKWIVVGNEQTVVNQLNATASMVQAQMMDANRAYQDKKQVLDSTFVATDPESI